MTNGVGFASLAQNVIGKMKGEGVGGILLRGSVGTFLVIILGYGVSFLANIVFARVMGAENYGVYIYVFTWVTFLALPSKLGLDTSSVRLVPQFIVQQQWSQLKGFLIFSRNINCQLSIIIGLILAGVIWLLKDAIEEDLFYTFLMGAMVLPIHTMLVVRASLLRGMKKVVLARMPEILQALFLMIFVGILWRMTNGSVSGNEAMVLRVISTGITLIFTIVLIQKYLPAEIASCPPDVDKKNWLKISVPMMLFSAMYILLNQTDIIMLGWFRNTTEAGIYSVSVKVAGLMLFSIRVVDAITTPMISELYSQGNKKDLQRMITLGARFTFGATLGLAVIIYLLDDFILGLFGSEFLDARTSLAILAMGQLIVAFAGSSGWLLLMTGHQNDASKVLAITVICNIILNAILIPKYGIEGAAMATAISNMFLEINLIRKVRGLLNIKPTAFSF